jgi:hypothetical protein
MFAVTEAEAAAIRAAFDQGGEFAAAVELRRLFPGVTSNAEAQEWARTIAAWKPITAGATASAKESSRRRLTQNPSRLARGSRCAPSA